MIKVVKGKDEELSLKLFAIIVLVTLGVLILAFWLLAPEAVWTAHMRAGWKRFTLAFVAIILINCFVEYFFHRYVLHRPVVPLFSYFYKQHHCIHHRLTRIVMRRTASGRNVPYVEVMGIVENKYPILDPEQKEASFFPWYTLAIFAILATLLLIPLVWLFPTVPWFFVGYGGIAFSLTLYEIFHSIEHWPFEKWAVLIEHRRWGRFWTKVYSFHLRHHAVTDCNEAISGFFLLPVADMVFGTYVIPKTLYSDGQAGDSAEFMAPRPCWLIRKCDEWADGVVSTRRKKA